MSVFGDFQRVWMQRFPESALPAAWEEDVRANLSKHKQKVAILREELEKEEFYVEYLERLLLDVEKHKTNPLPIRTAPPPPEVDDNSDKVRDSTPCIYYRPRLGSYPVNIKYICYSPRTIFLLCGQH